MGSEAFYSICIAKLLGAKSSSLTFSEDMCVTGGSAQQRLLGIGLSGAIRFCLS